MVSNLDKIELLEGDITQQEVDAIVNAANSHLAGGGGVDGAIHRAGGPEIMQELKAKYTGCPTGSAVITAAGKLKAKYVIHAVGPRWCDGDHGEPKQLASAYRTSLALAHEHGCRTVAFPSISTGIYGYPVEQAAPLALRTLSDALTECPVDRILFVLFDTDTYRAYEKALRELKQD